MLGKLFGSNSRVKLLKLFLLHPEEKYYIRQISRDLKLQLNSVRRELENLEKFGLLNSFQAKEIEQGNGGSDPESSKHEKKYYKADKNFVLFEEIKNLIVKAQVLYEKDFIEKIKKIGNIKLLILTGIFAGQNASPVDLLVVGKLNKIKLVRIIKELEHELGRDINYTFMEPREFKYRRDMTDVFLYQILESNKILVINEIGMV
jgi:hypothetical protein